MTAVGQGLGQGDQDQSFLPGRVRRSRVSAAREAGGSHCAALCPGSDLVSAGFDGHARDPLAGMALHETTMRSLCT